MAPRDAPEVLVKEVIREDWDGTFDGLLGSPVTPSIHHGWVDVGSDRYEVTVSNPEESPVRGGETGYSGMAGDGSGPVRDVAGTVAVNCWARRGWSGTSGNSITNPRQAAYLFKWEVERILQAHATATTAAGASTDLQYYAPQGSNRFVDTSEDPAIYRYQVIAGFGYNDLP